MVFRQNGTGFFSVWFRVTVRYGLGVWVGDRVRGRVKDTINQILQVKKKIRVQTCPNFSYHFIRVPSCPTCAPGS